jgi:glyoxylase I family protein
VSRVLAIHHVSLLVSDTQRALEFYCGVLGLEPDDGRPDMGFPGAWLQVGAQQIHLIALADPCVPAAVARHGGRDRHVALQVTELDAIRSALLARGVEHTLSRSGRRALFCRDPDGNALELIEVPGEALTR